MDGDENTAWLLTGIMWGLGAIVLNKLEYHCVQFWKLILKVLEIDIDSAKHLNFPDQVYMIQGNL